MVTSVGQHVQVFLARVFEHVLVEPNVVADRYLHGLSTVDEQKLLAGQTGVRSKVLVQRESEDAVGLRGKSAHVYQQAGRVQTCLVKVHQQ